MDRRDFFHPGAISKLLETPLSVNSSVTNPPTLGNEAKLICFSRKAMGTVFEWTFPFGLADIHAKANGAFELIDQMESVLSAYQYESEVCRANRNGRDGEWLSLSTALWELCKKSSELWKISGGAFDPTMGALIRAWGFLKGPFRVPEAPEIEELKSQSGMENVAFHPNQKKIRHLKPEVDWNFGAIGKGFAIDFAARWLTSRLPKASFLLHSGRSSIYAKGSSPSEDSGWVVQLNHPSNGKPMANLRLVDSALGTSATTYRKFEMDGKTYGHVLDPRSGNPSEGMTSVTVCAPDCTTADALSTAVFVAGAGLAEKLALENPSLGFFLLEKDPEAEPLVLGAMKNMLVTD
jgi:thiamine biosynthesis lipoprotein